MVNLGTVQQDSTVRFMFSTAAADGGREDFSASMEEADFIVVKDGSAMTLDASTLTITMPFNTDTGVHLLAIDTSNDADFTGGSTYWVYVHPDETVDTQSVAGVLGVFSIESDSEKAARLLREYLMPDSVVATTTGNTTTAVNMTEVLDAQQANDSLIGQLLLIHDATDDELHWATITDFANTNLLATVEKYPNGGALDITVAANDHLWIVSSVYAARIGTQEDGTNLTEAGGTGDHLSAVPWNAAWDAEVQSEAQDALDATLTFTKANELDVNVQSINGAAVVGDGNATPWDGA